MEVTALVKAFVTGGLICVAGQILIDKTKLMSGRILVLYVCLGCVLGGLGLYQKLEHFAGAGATVPLTGFGYALGTGVVDAIDQYGFMGVFCGGITATAAGITAAIFFGFIMSLIFKSGDK